MGSSAAQGPQMTTQYGLPPPKVQRPGYPPAQGVSKTADSGEYYQSTENDYYRTWQMQRHLQAMGQRTLSSPRALPKQLPPPPYNTNAHSASGSSSSDSYQRNQQYGSEHIYESPKFDRKAFPDPAQGAFFDEDDDPLSRDCGNGKLTV